jgi:SAM-dependent methyltransferase
MSVSVSGPGLPLPPSSSLPHIRSLVSAPEEQITAALRSLQALYCPLRLPKFLPNPLLKKALVPVVSTPSLVDSGYASRDEEHGEDGIAAAEEAIAAICVDPFERAFATRWLTSLISRIHEMGFDEQTADRIVDDAAFILSCFADSSKDEALTRDFAFPMASGAVLNISLNDAPLSGVDHTDVGLQSWGASVVLSSMLCTTPDRFFLTPQALPNAPKVLELGAGTGLVSLTLAKLLPELAIAGADLTATDYHPAVLENCKANIETNFGPCDGGRAPLSTIHLDWSRPPPQMHSTVDLLVASDVVYAPEHAAWLRDCAAHLLKPDGVFWLMVTVRQSGKFEGIPNTAEAAFDPKVCPRSDTGKTFKILETQQVEKRRGIGRGDESGYVLYKIGWTCI